MHVLVIPVNVRGGQSACDNNFLLRCSLYLPQLGKDAVGLASPFGYISIV